jgi:cyclic beta-1,2-glucan synthetase
MSTMIEAPPVLKSGTDETGRFFIDISGNDPIRAELYGLEHLQTHARQLAQASEIIPKTTAGHPLLRRFVQNGRRLFAAHAWISGLTRREESITPDAEWLLDNFHIVEDTLREIRVDLPHGYYRKLPKLAHGPFAGYPRVYALALELIAHTDSSLDETNITRFVQAYQTVSSLAIGELWAVPIMLRLSLVENLRRLSDQMIEAWVHRHEAQSCCEHLVAHKDHYERTVPPPAITTVLQPQANWSDPFVVWLLQSLRDRGPEASWLIEWLESHLTDTGRHPVEVLRREHQRQAGNQVSVGNCVTSLRLLSALDWNVLFERMGLVEAVLKDDPAGVYAKQDFPTKDRYRRIVEKLARGAHCDELAVARCALALSRREPAAAPSALPQRGDRASAHVGYYLIGNGRPELEAAMGYRPTWPNRLLQAILLHPRSVYFGALAVTFALLIAVVMSIAVGQWTASAVLLLLAFLLPASELAVGLVHYCITKIVPPRVLPKLDLKDGIPGEYATVIVMPTMLIRQESATVLADRLEVHYLSNPDPNLYFALLTDFADAPTETVSEDEEYVRAAHERIKVLNERYAAGGPDRFFFFHRRRVWNPVQGCWMGWERKRGKLEEFNGLLRGSKDTTFTTTSGSIERLPRIRYVITLDADTQLPREAARRLIGALAHPLNRARLDPDLGRVVEGYGILQPRVSLSLVAAMRSLFARILTASAGIDPYTTAVSDVYQDLFGLGSFTGKGIYDVDAFAQSAGRAFPENAILSHDLIEGNFARCGLVTDIEFLDEFPARYHAYAYREHRWIRGDWQLVPWLAAKVPAPDELDALPPYVPSHRRRTVKRPNPLSLVERWKILDNLRRSLVPPSIVGLLVVAWLVPGSVPWIWTTLALAIVALPLILLLATSLFTMAGSGSWKLKFRDLLEKLRFTGGQSLLSIIFLAEQARLATDAIVRTLLRLSVTRRNLLEWETAAAAEHRLGNGFVHFCLAMWVPPVLAVGLGALVTWMRPASLWSAASILIAWFVSPAIAFWVSRPRMKAEEPLSSNERLDLRRLARKIWGFFDRFVTDDDHWLPPDNYQEDPKGSIAHRTSPTNVGLCLVSTLSAHDFGYLSLSALLDRLEKTFDTLDRLERVHGHLYNWYDTKTLRPLQPGYVSTVDSGNLLACLLALKQGLREKAEEPIPHRAACEGLTDTVSLVDDELRSLDPPSAPEHLEVFQSLELLLKKLDEQLAVAPTDLLQWKQRLEKLNSLATELLAGVDRLTPALKEIPEQLAAWCQRLSAQVAQHRDELRGVAPWLDVISEGDGPNSGSSIGEHSRAIQDRMTRPGSLADLQGDSESALAELTQLRPPWPNGDKLASALRSSTAGELLLRCQNIADRASALAGEMDFKLLYNEQRNLFSIGYNVAHSRQDNAHYDLLASEACLTSFLAIARGDAPKRHWFHLGRPLTRAAGSIALLSWGGTMFEYLMPRLFLRSYSGTLLDESCQSAVDRQIEYGRQHRVPWGISESAFSALDAALDYQYQAFGVPGLGLKRGLGDSLVIAPYATTLALIVRPRAALENIHALRNEGAENQYGFYEALDFTRDRRIEKRRPAMVRSYMVHHQGMSLVALVNYLNANTMVRRFHSEPMVRATELLLQERVPRKAPLMQPHGDETGPAPLVRDRPHPMSRVVTTPHTPHPRAHLISNGRLNTMVTSAGGGYCTWKDLDVTRWREDRTRDCWGPFLYIRDFRSGLAWSASHQPLARVADSYEVVFSSDKAEFRRSDAGVESHLEITVSPENAAEVRRLTLTNNNPRTHELDVTSYVEVVIGPHGADLAHPAFGKLFLETEFLADNSALLCRRRPRSADQKPIWAIHVLAVDGPTTGDVQFETDRQRFLGRGRTPSNPAALDAGAVLSGATGSVLDPVFSLRQRLRIRPGATVSLAFTTAVAESREEALALADQYHDVHGVNRAFELAWAHSQVLLQHLRLSPEETHLFQRLAAHIIYTGASLRSTSSQAANLEGQPGLWRMGISGDKPIILARIAENEELSLVRQLLLAHAYWRLKGLTVDLVILNDHPASYLENLHEQIQNLVRVSESHVLIDKPGGVFVRRSVQLSEEDKVLLQAAARVVLIGSRGSLEAQVDRSERALPMPARLTPAERTKEPTRATTSAVSRASVPKLLFFNGLGGFTTDGREYWIFPYGRADAVSNRPGARFPQGRDQIGFGLPPSPWINVVANPSFGFLASDGGLGYTWADNSQSNRLTPWNNDPVTDAPGEIVYLRDETTGDYWTPTPLPCGLKNPASVSIAAQPASSGAETPLGHVRHGQGYTVFHQTSHGLEQELLVFVPANDPIKIMRLKVRNLENRTRQVSATFFCEWVLGTVRDDAALHVVPSYDSESGALLARNAFNSDFAGRLAFAAVNRRPRTFTADRTEFLGRNGSPAAPAALGRVTLSGRVDAGLDPCAAFMAPFDLRTGEEKEVVFFLGETSGTDEIQRLLRRYRDPALVQAAFEEAVRRWDRILTTVEVQAPDAALNLLLNRWLGYQILSCRVWGRTAFYQSSGAYGFRDQLQDVMALVYGAPEETRAQILHAAGRQFLEGDVQHWWHPPSGRGVRTRFSDDLLWLPFVTWHYVNASGDYAILDERITFLRAPTLRPDQEEDYGLPEVTAETGSLYEHCVRAIEHALRFGSHGLPLMGTGDWNDGMNRIGSGGKGESVWDAWFFLTILPRFADLAEKRADTDLAARYREQAERLRLAVEEHAWDGEWYRRAYFDDGTPLGSKQNDECKIDSIAQSWAVIAGVANPDRARQAMAAVEQHLVRHAEKLILLFAPPFDKGNLQPGYIKGYVPGIRENGGQYTHAATWVVQATALLGEGTKALELFNLLNPINHAASPGDVARYKVEPYVVAADVYGKPPHVGRGGWTWYSGSPGWLYRIALENLLGFHLVGNRLRIDPCIPSAWKRYEITYRYRSTTYHITVENPGRAEHGVASVRIDGSIREDQQIELTDDGRVHEVQVEMSASAPQ